MSQVSADAVLKQEAYILFYVIRKPIHQTPYRPASCSPSDTPLTGRMVRQLVLTCRQIGTHQQLRTKYRVVPLHLKSVLAPHHPPFLKLLPFSSPHSRSESHQTPNTSFKTPVPKIGALAVSPLKSPSAQKTDITTAITSSRKRRLSSPFHEVRSYKN